MLCSSVGRHRYVKITSQSPQPRMTKDRVDNTDSREQDKAIDLPFLLADLGAIAADIGSGVDINQRLVKFLSQDGFCGLR